MTNIFIQEPSQSAVDTLSDSYSESWQALEGIEQSSGFIQIMASNDLIFVVLGVSLIIWFILLFFIVKVDRNISKIETALEEKDL